MIVEHEVIEQIEENADGQPISWVCNLIRSLGRDDPLVVLQGMLRAGHLTLVRPGEGTCSEWECSELFRAMKEPLDIYVLATECGSTWVHGR